MEKLYSIDGLDIKDRKILYCLFINSRLSINAIAKLTDLSRDIVSYRIDKLKEDGILLLLTTLTNIWNIEHYRYHIAIKLKSMTQEEEKEIRKKLLKNQYVTWLARAQGRYDWGIGITAPSKQQAYWVLNNVVSLFRNNFNSYTIFESLDEKYLEPNYLLDKETSSKIKHEALKIRDRSSYMKELINNNHIDKNFKLDAKDLRILKKIEIDCRKPVSKISEELGIPASTIHNRIRKLVQNKVIKSFFPVISEMKIGLTRCWVLLQTAISDHTKEKRIERFIESHPYIVYRTKLIGDWNLYLEITYKNIEHFREIMQEVKEFFGEDLMSYEHLNLLEEIKCEYLPGFLEDEIKKD